MTTVEANVKGFTKELSEPPHLHDEEAGLRKEKDEKEITTDEELFGPNDVISDEEKEKPSSTKVEPLEEVLKLEISKVELIKSGEEPPAYYTSKLPRFIRVKKQNEAFEPELFEPDLVPVEESNPETSLALTEALRNTIRWRYSNEVSEGPNPEEKMESNANIVTWEDGSMSLVIDGAFHDLEKKLVKPPLPSSAIGDHKRKPFRQEEPELFAIYHPSVGCLECVDKVNGSLNVRLEASMMDLSRRSKLISLSENHQKLSIEDATAKAKRVTQYIVVTKDPEKEREKIEKLEAQKEKQRKLELAKRNRLQRPSGTGPGRGSKRGGRAGDILDEEEDDDLEDAWEAYDNHGNSRANLRTSDGYADDGFVVEDEEDQEALSGDDRPDEEELKRKSKKRKQRSNDSKKNRGQWKVDGRGKKKWRGEAPGRRFMGDDNGGGAGDDDEGEEEEEDFDDEEEEEFDEEQEEEEDLEELSQENREPVEEGGGEEEEQVKQESTIESSNTAAAAAAAAATTTTTPSTSTATTTVRVAKKRLAVLDSDEEEM